MNLIIYHKIIFQLHQFNSIIIVTLLDNFSLVNNYSLFKYRQCHQNIYFILNKLLIIKNNLLWSIMI